MSFKDYNVEISYKSVGDKTISNIINKLLVDTVLYQRSVGFFSASALDFISDGIHSLLKNNGKIDKKAVENAVKTGNTDSLVNSLSKEDKQKLLNLMSDKQAMKDILKSPEAQALLKLFGGKNG